MPVDISSAFIERSISGIADCAVVGMGVREWLNTGTYAIDTKSDDSSIILAGVKISEILPYLASDFWRVSFASIESYFQQVDTSISRYALAWPIVRNYYAAYFAAHSLLRAVGRSIVRIELLQTRKLNELCQIYTGRNFEVSAGAYSVGIEQINASDLSLTLNKINNQRGGDHQSFWFAFSKFLDALADDIAKRQDIDSTNLIARLLEIKAALHSDGHNDGGWLSTFRNNVNYKHKYGVWFPYEKIAEADRPYTRNYRSSANIRLDINPQKRPLSAFESVTAFLSLLNVDVAQKLVERSSSSNSIYRKRWNRCASIVLPKNWTKHS